MEKEKIEKLPVLDSLSTLMAQFGHEAKKIKKVNQSVAYFAKQAEIQCQNVNQIADNSASILQNKLKSKISGKRSLDGLVAGMSSVDLREQVQNLLRSQKEGSMEENTSKRSKIEHKKFNSYGLPVTSQLPPVAEDDDVDLLSESDSEFLPDWSSAGSCVTNQSNSNFADDEFDIGITSPVFGSSSSDVWLLSDDDMEDDTFAKDRESRNNLNLTPVCGNSKIQESDVNDKLGCSNSNASSTSESKVDDKFSCHAIRRVKSMAHDIAIDREVDENQRIRVLKFKNRNDVLGGGIPSPLLSREDATSVHKTQSVTNAKFSLKRSRSNITVATAYSKAHRDNIVIYEESEEDEI